MSEIILSPVDESVPITFRPRAVVCLFDQLEEGGATAVDLASLPPDIAERIPSILQDFDRLRILVKSGS